ncbi:E3 ubiquitin-protein ligase MYCBP2-like [Anneissia japonica]|uniref:E3 ubiquitin-protein ligase MYCBP2-like n=1 Tax=Anneissia japonica TaxID=1529436 RepID=UPI0014256B65|nr:E3 ubiquitin-protein ligase MYCBP2-like [Anneissia japonica]
MSLESSNIDHRESDFLVGDPMGLKFYNLFSVKDKEDTDKKKSSVKKKTKKKSKKGVKEKAECSLDNSNLQAPLVELQSNPSAFNVYAAVRQCLLKREVQERAIALSNISEKQEDEDEDAEITDELMKLPKIVGIGLRSMFELVRETYRTHPHLCFRAMEALLDMLQGQTPEGLSKEPPEVMDSLFQLLLQLSTSPCSPDTPARRAKELLSLSTSCLLSMVIARGDTGKLLSAVSAILMSPHHMTGNQMKIPAIVSNLQRSLQSVLIGSICQPDWETDGVTDQSQVEKWKIHGIRSSTQPATIATDGAFMYIHNNDGLYRVGTGYAGTIRGHIYHQNPEFSKDHPGWLGVVNGRLLFCSREKPGQVRHIQSEKLVEDQTSPLPIPGNSVPAVMFSDGEQIGSVTATDQDTFRIQTWHPSNMGQQKGSDLYVKLARKSTEVYGPPLTDQAKDKTKHILDLGADIDCLEITAGKDFAFARTNAGKVMFAGKAHSLGMKREGQGATKWTPLTIQKSPKIVQCAVGHEGHHALMVADDGAVYFTGLARRGEDGDQVKGQRNAKPNKPKKVLKMDGKHTVFAACNSGSSAMVTKEGELYMFGKDTQEVDSNTGLVTELKDTPVLQVALGKQHTCILTKAGVVWTSGINKRGQCGRGPPPGQASKEGAVVLPAEEEVEEEEVDKDDEPMCDHEWKHEQCMICTICNECTGYGANCINTINAERNPGMLCGCGSGDSGCSKCGSCRSCAGEGKGQLRGAMFQNIIRHKNISDRDLLAQLQQVFFKKEKKSRLLDKLLHESKAFDEGSISGDDREGEKEISQPNVLTLAEILINDNKVPAVQVVCGSYHSVVLLSNGDVYAFGMGNHGQLGQGDTENRYSACRVPVNEPIIQVAAGNHHTVLLASSGCVYTFGQFQKGQLGRPVNEDKNDQDAVSHLVPGRVPDLGPEHGRKGNWVQASGDRTFVKVDESLIGANTLEKSLVFATFDTIGIIPKDESSGVKCMMVNRSEGQCRSFSEVNSINQYADCVTFDPIYNILWSYNTERCEVVSYSAIKPRIRVLVSQPDHTLSVFSPELALPSTNQGKVTSSQCALYILASLDTLTASQLEGWSVVEGLENQATKPSKSFTKDDFNVVQRFEAYGGGWGYSGHSIEALRVSVDTNVELGGLGLFGGRGEYTAKIAIYDLGPSSDYEGEGELLAESDDIIYECGTKEKFPVLFDEPVPLTSGHWYTITAKISGPSSDCGSSGQASVTTEDQVVFTFKSSKKTNNGTDVNAGQIPQVLYRLCQQDSGLSRRETQLENVHILNRAFSSTVTPEAFDSLTKLLEWSLKTFRDVAKETTAIKGTALTAILLDLERLVYIATASMRLLRNYICEIYSKTGKQSVQETNQLAECVGNTGILLRMILKEPSKLMKLLARKSQCLKLWQRIQDQCHRTFVQCFHAFYPTSQLKWTCLCWQLNTMNQINANNGYLLASVLEALCDTSIRLTSVLPITKDHEVELVLMKHSSMDDNFPTMVSTDPMSSKFPELVAYMEQTTQVETGSCNSFREMLDRLLDILSISVREMMMPGERPSHPPLLVTNTCSLLGCLVSELAAISTGTESENQATSRPLCKTPSRFSRCSQARGWSTGNGTPDAICFSVDKPGIVIAGFCVYGGHSRYNYELELLDNSEGGDGHGHRWNTLELIKGMYCPDDCTNDIAEIKFEKPVQIKEGVKYAVRLRNHGSRTVNGDNGMSSVKCSDGVTFTFTSCVLSSNGTNHTRGQIPQILYYNTALECEKSGPETKSADMEYQARKNALYVTSAIVHTACDLLQGAQETLKGSEVASTLGESQLFTHLLPLVLAHTTPVGSSDPRSAVQVLGLVKELLPLVTAVNLQTDPPLNYSSANGQSGDIMTDSNAVTTSNHYAVVESDHPYKPATVSHYKVKYPDTVKWLILEFDQQCGTAQQEDSVQLYIPARGQPKPAVKEGDELQPKNTHWPVLNRFHGDSNWPTNSVVLPGNEVVFSLETASDYVKDEKASRYGFKCAVVGYEWPTQPRQGLLHLEKELSHIGGMCASSLMKKELSLPPEEEETEEEPEPITEAAQQIFNLHSVLLSKGFALATPPTIHQALSGNLPINTEYNERSFLQDYVHCTPNSSGGRLARWFQPESYVEPKQCDIIYQRDELKCRKATVITLKTHDQYGILVHVPHLKVEAEAVPLGKQDHHLDSQSMKPNRKGEKDMTFGGHPTPQVDTSFEPVIRKDSMAYNSITMMKEYENYSFEELRFAHLPAKRPSESMLVRANNDGSFSAHWTPGLSGLYAIHFTIDGYPMEDVPKVEVGEPPQGVVAPPPVKKTQSQPNKTRQFVAKFSSGLRIRRSPSLQSEQIGKIDVNGIITYVDEIQNEDGVWVRLNKDSIHRFCGTNGFREGWCMQFNQHIGKTFLIPVDESKTLKKEENKENIEDQKKGQEKKADKSKALGSIAGNIVAERGVYHVIHCGASGHNIRCGPSLKDIPIGMMVQGNHLNVVQVKRHDGCLWVKLDEDSMSRYCDSIEGEAWALAKGKGILYLVHEKALNSEMMKKDGSEILGTQNLFKINGGSLPSSKTSGFDFKNALTHPAFKFNMQEVHEVPKVEPFVFGGGGPFMTKSWSEEFEGKVFLEDKLQKSEDECGETDIKKTDKPSSRLVSSQKIESRFSKMRASSPGRLQRETEASNRQSGTSSPVRVASRDSSPASRSSSLTRTLDGHFSIGTGSNPSSPKMQGSPKMVRKARSQYSRRERTSSPSGKDRSPARSRGAKRTEVKDVARQAIAPSVAECVRAVFAAFLWHEGIVHDAMACASYLKFNPGLTKQAAQREQDKQDIDRNSKIKNRHSMDLSKAIQDGSFLATMGTIELTSNKNEMPSQAKDGKSSDKPVSISEIRSKSSDHISTAARSLEETLKSAAWQKDRIPLEVKASLNDDIRARSSSAGPEDLHKSASLESGKTKVEKKAGAETESALPLTLQYLLSFWEELTSATVNVASQKLVLPSPAPITKSKGRVERREREKEKDSKGKKKEKKSIRGGRGNLFGEAAGIPAGGSDQDATCDLCHGFFPHPVTYHMKQNHPGCGKHAGGQGYNSSGHYCGGWAGNCGDGGIGGSSWYLMCDKCKEKYVKERQEKAKEKIKKLKVKPLPLKTPKVLPPLEAHNVMKANAMFLLDLASSAGTSSSGGTKSMHRMTRFELPSVSEIDQPSLQQPHFPLVPFKFLDLMGGQQRDQDMADNSGKAFHVAGEDVNPLLEALSTEDRQLGNIAFGPPQHSISTSSLADQDSVNRVMYVRSISMTTSGEQYDGKTKVRRRINSGNSSASESGSSLLRRPSVLLAKLMDNGPRNCRALHRPVMNFIAHRHDLEGLRLAMRQAVRKASCRVYALQAFNWLLRSVTQLTCLHDLLWHFVVGLAPAPTEKDEEGEEKEKNVPKEQDQEKDNIMCEHPLSDIIIAGDAVNPLPTAFHTLLQTISDMMMQLPIGSALQQMAMRCWCLRFQPADHIFLHHSHVFSNINKILSKAEGEVDEGGLAINGTAVEKNAQNSAMVELLKDLTHLVEVRVSSRVSMCSSLTDGATETFWESGDEDRNKTKWISLGIPKGLVGRMAMLHIDNSRDLANKITQVMFQGGSSAEDLMTVQQTPLDLRHSGWISCDLMNLDLTFVKITLKGPDNHVRVRQVKFLGYQEGTSINLGQVSALVAQQKNCEAETLRVFRLLTSQVFGKLLAEDMVKNGKNKESSRTKQDSGDPDLKEHMVGILFSNSKLTNLQKQVCSHIVQAIHKETTKTREEWEFSLTKQTGQSPPEQQPASSADAYCFELLSMVLALSGSSVGRAYVAQKASLVQDLLSLLHTGSPRVQRQVTAILRKVLPEITPSRFASITGSTLPIMDINCITSSAEKPKASEEEEETLGVLEVFLAVITKALTVQTKMKGAGSGKLVQSITLASTNINGTEETAGNKRWWIRGVMSHGIAESTITLIKDIAMGKLGDLWASVCKAAVAEALLALTRIEESKRVPAECLKTHTLWLSLASLCVLEQEHVERLSSSELSKKDGQAAKHKPLCDNHDDSETPAIVSCNQCGNLCADCDKFLHLHSRTRSHQRQVFKEEEEAIKIDLHEGCGRSKLFWVMILADSKTLKAMVDFKESGSTGNSHGSAGRGSCRFCGGQASGLGTAAAICDDCQGYAETACMKVHSCEHICGGIKGEEKHLACLQGCSGDPTLKQDSDDMCMVCFTEALSCAPALQLECGHVFHYHCCLRVLEKRWVGPRITFGFVLCPICKVDMENKMLEAMLEPIRTLQQDVKRKALMRLEYEGLNKCEAITMPGARFYQDPAGFAINRYAYYVCFKCKKAYYGGEARCDQGGVQEYDPAELVCGGCSDVSRAQMCPKHGTDFLEYKCRYCCSVAVFFCFGTTHFCNACHDDFQRITTIAKQDLPRCPAGPKITQLEGDECPLHVEHPATGEEFALGCGVCRNAHTF